MNGKATGLQTHSLAIDDRVFFAAKFDHQRRVRISPTKKMMPIDERRQKANTHDEAQPISGFSQRSFVSHSTFHFFVLCVPDCIALRAGIKIRQRRSLIKCRGTPDRGAIDS